MERLYMLPLGALASNCYIIPAENGKAVVIDPASASEVSVFLKSKELTLGGIIVTHGHFDHFAGAAQLSREYSAPVWAPAADAEMLSSPEKSWAEFMPHVPFEAVVPDNTFSNGDVFSVCGVNFRAMACPGHTAGSCVLFCPTLDNTAFTGDVIFNGAIGRTDGYSGSGAQMRKSLEKLSALAEDYTLCCGHGPMTTLAHEQKHNPYL